MINAWMILNYWVARARAAPPKSTPMVSEFNIHSSKPVKTVPKAFTSGHVSCIRFTSRVIMLQLYHAFNSMGIHHENLIYFLINFISAINRIR